MRYAAIAMSLSIVFLLASCGKKAEQPSTEKGKTPAALAASPKELYFPPEEKPMRVEEADLATLLEEYVTPHLKVLPLREKDKEALPPNTVAIRFNYPMVAKERVGVPSPQGVWSFIPYRAGTYTWRDESILTFSPNRPWESDAEVTGLIPTGLASVGGYKLLEPYQEEVAFKGGVEIAGKLISTDEITPGEPKVIGIDPPVGETLGNVPGVVLIFDQPVLVDYVRGKVEMAVKGRGESDFRIVPHALLHAKGTMIRGARVADNYTVLVKPVSPLPFQSDVKLTLAAELKEADEFEAQFQTPMPLLVEAVSCQQWTACRIEEAPAEAQQQIAISDATGYLKLRFNDSLESAMAKEVVISPTPKQQKAEVVDKILYLSWDWQPGTNYAIRFTDRFRNRYGFKLARPVAIALRTGHLLPAIEAPIGLKAIDRGKETALKLKWRNLSSVHIRQYPVTGDGLASSLQYFFKPPSESYFPAPAEERPAEISFSGNPEGNAWQEARVPLSQLMAKQGAGIFYLQYETDPFVPQTPESAKRLSAFVQVTDIGLSAKRLPDGLFVEASSMATGAPLAGVAVTVLTLDGSVVAEGATDEGGALTIGLDDAADLLKAPLILAEREGEGDAGADSAYLWIGDKRISADFFELPRPLTSTIDAARKEEGAIDGFVFTDKGVYRGGQTMHIKGYVALPEDAEAEEVELTLHAPNSEDALMEETVALEDRPSFQFDWRVGPDAAPGRYRLDAALPDGAIIASADLLIADTTNATFKLDLSNPRKALLAGEPWEVELRPEYFFGLPVAFGTIEHSVYSSPVKFAPPGFEGYDFHDRYAEDAFDQWHEWTSNQRTSLSGSGVNRLSMPTREEWWDENVSAPLRFYLSATVTDISGDAMTADAEAIAYPSDLYVGLADRYEYAKDRPLVFEWVALSALDRKVLSGVEATAELYRLEEHWYQEEGVEEESFYSESETLRELVASCQARSSASREGCSLGAQPPGRYALRIASKGTNGVMVAAAREIAVAGGGLMPVAESKKHLVKPTMDRESYRPGETGFVLFENPYPKGHATITVENGEILDRTTVAVEEGMMKVPVKIKEEYAPNAFVGVHVSVGRRGQIEDGSGSDVSGPTYLAGYAPLSVDLALQRLGVAIAADKGQYRPGEKVRIDLSVTDGLGKPVKEGEVTLFAVDESTLELTKYRTPEPLPAIYPERPLAVEIADNRTKAYSTDYLLSVMEKGQVGGDGWMEFDEFAKKRVRKDFPDTIFWKPDLTTDAGGRARAEFALSDATGSVRVMAVAHKDGRLFGSAEMALRVALPLSADPILPKFLVRGDAFDARVRIHNTTREAQVVTASLVAPLAETKEVRVEAGGTAVATFAIEAPAEGAELPVEIALRSKNFSDTIKKKIPVHDDFALKTRDVNGTFVGDELLHLMKPESWEGPNAVRLRFSSVPVPDLARTLYSVLTYPYASAASVVSTISAVATMRDRLGDFRPKDFPADDVLREHIAARVKMLAAYQLAGGGLSDWPKGTAENLFETANTLFLLSQVDFDRDDTISDALEKRVQEIAKLGVDGSSTEDKQRVAALALAALAFAGEEDDALGTQLAALRQRLSTFSLAMTIIGLSKMGKSKDVEGLLPFLAQHLREPAVPIGERAVGAMALVSGDPKHPLVQPLLQSLFSGGDASAPPPLAATTLLAYAVYVERAKRASAPKLDLVLDGRELEGDALRKENALQVALDLPLEAEGLLKMTSTNGKAVYFSAGATVRDRFSTAPEARVSRGIRLFSAIEDREGKEADWGNLALGELYHVRLYVKADGGVEGFFLDIPLPAGLSPQSIIAPQGAATPDTSGGDEGDEEEEGGDRRYLLVERARETLSHTEYHADRVRFFSDELPEGFFCFDFYARAANPGQFLMPPPEAGSMADPDVWARLPAARVSVKEL